MGKNILMDDTGRSDCSHVLFNKQWVLLLESDGPGSFCIVTF